MSALSWDSIITKHIRSPTMPATVCHKMLPRSTFSGNLLPVGIQVVDPSRIAIDHIPMAIRVKEYAMGKLKLARCRTLTPSRFQMTPIGINGMTLWAVGKVMLHSPRVLLFSDVVVCLTSPNVLQSRVGFALRGFLLIIVTSLEVCNVYYKSKFSNLFA